MSLASLDWKLVRQHYDEREAAHRRLLALHKGGQKKQFFDLAVGISDKNGNYSAVEHSLGPKIIAHNTNPQQRVFELASNFLTVKSGLDVPSLIRAAALSYLQIGVGSELSCMMNPTVCWVANSRTIWAHLLIKHNDNYSKADEELKLYRDSDASSEMAYRIWVDIHKTLDTAMTRLATMGTQEAKAHGIKSGSFKYLWADAVANELYAEHFY
ncbi:hypothetical protein predicted by Glimmer/Critica [Sorangium cellulosum So ce56]|uniref:Uncharacterized protein n=1 Tax=Sorangium cellulosum (strain So ce56) TaxID=448385 RepID=A9EVG8_SORC5|nr:hypothetical protein [Sorangium cellulosum]CAN94222.1 hypothetical protein predicted by Glimmer/Critica [Sorangium cellulosum So ce56]